MSNYGLFLFQNESGSDEEGDKMEVEGTFVAHVPVPSQKEVEEMLVRRKKRVRDIG